MNSRKDLHFNLNEWPTGSKSVDQELHEVIDRAFDLEEAAAQVLKAWGVTETKDSGWDRDGTFRRLHDATHNEV